MDDLRLFQEAAVISIWQELRCELFLELFSHANDHGLTICCGCSG